MQQSHLGTPRRDQRKKLSQLQHLSDTTSAEPACIEEMGATSFVNAKEVERWHVCLPVDYVCPRAERSISNQGMEVE